MPIVSESSPDVAELLREMNPENLDSLLPELGITTKSRTLYLVKGFSRGSPAYDGAK